MFQLPGNGLALFCRSFRAAWCLQAAKQKGKRWQSCSERKAKEAFQGHLAIAEERGFGVFIQIYNALVVMVSKHYIMGLKQEQWPGAVI